MKGSVKYGILRVTFKNSNPLFSKVIVEGSKVTLIDDKGNPYGSPFECDVKDIIFVTKNLKDMENLNLIEEPTVGTKINDLFIHYVMDSGYLVSKSAEKTRLFLVKKDDPALKVKGSDYDIDKKGGN